MTKIDLVTHISAPPERCFDLARDLDLHLRSMAHTGERAIAGRTSGLIELGEQVTWHARHFGFEFEHTSRITAYDRPKHFRDSMVSGQFRTFEHDHFFQRDAGLTVMRDVLEFQAPLGPLGRIAEVAFLKRYLTQLLIHRNATIKLEAENS